MSEMKLNEEIIPNSEVINKSRSKTVFLENLLMQEMNSTETETESKTKTDEPKSIITNTLTKNEEFKIEITQPKKLNEISRLIEKDNNKKVELEDMITEGIK